MKSPSPEQMADKRARLEEAIKHLTQEKSFFTVVGWEQINLIIAELSKAWEQVEVGREVLGKIGAVDTPSAADKTAWIVMGESMGLEARRALERMTEIERTE